ncbi:SDR family NAD(P)-dependent oxidoreductase [Paenibacillus sp. GCM10027626]|uniref:SDR family NAD(P)-dependent oxidoreductase n=1 Tax=Paenibacillus sp. GCM10027626 TaxID=3273411 RepID=UPI003629D2A1
MKYFIITGTSRGLGQAIAEQLISPDHYLFCISRGEQQFSASSGNIAPIAFDLKLVDQLEALMERIFAEIDLSKAEGIYLINNASMIAPVSFIDAVNVNDIAHNFHVNLLAPIMLTSLFIKHTNNCKIPKRVINISSASVKNHHPGMSLYSAAKAGLDVFSQCAALEQKYNQAPVGIVSVWPGMIDTRLQQEAREQDKAAFPSADIFGMAKAAGMLAAPADTAQRIIEFLFKENFEHGAVVDLLGGAYE